MIRDAGVSKTLSALSDDALKDEALCAELVQSLTPEALQAAGLSRQDDRGDVLKRKRCRRSSALRARSPAVSSLS